MDLMLLVARVLLAGVFGIAGVAKLADRAGSRQALQDFGVPTVLASPLECSCRWLNSQWPWPCSCRPRPGTAAPCARAPAPIRGRDRPQPSPWAPTGLPRRRPAPLRSGRPVNTGAQRSPGCRGRFSSGRGGITRARAASAG